MRSYTKDHTPVHEEKNIVHGDLTGVCSVFMYNIWLNSTDRRQTNVLVDNSGNLRFADFGLSMLLAEAENVTFNSVHPGNARWMAPEFFMPPEDGEEDLQSQKPTKAGDIYSFGCVMLQVC
jgi:serine/threonine protein kinase